MADRKHEQQPTQKTRPKKGKPAEIPVPKREDFESALKQATRRRDSERSAQRDS